MAAYGGTARLFEQFPPSCQVPYCAGYYLIVDHVNGHKTRYLHLQSRAVTNGQTVPRGAVVGYEGNSGTEVYHLHFETRHNATAGDCCSGTAVDPYYSGTYMWTTNPPSYPPPPAQPSGCSFNGAGPEDLAVGVSWEGVNGKSYAGAIAAIYGSGNGLASSNDQFLHQDTNGTWVDSDAEVYDYFGKAVACGAFDGDGDDDLAIGVT